MTTRRYFLRVIGTAAASAAAAAGCEDEDSVLGSGGQGGQGPGGSGGLGVGGEAAGGSGGMMVVGPQEVGDLADLNEGDLLPVAAVRIFVGLDAEGVYAMSSACTHSNCNLITHSTILSGNGRRCSCHGSRFDVEGHVTMGPAQNNLVHYHVELQGTTIVVDNSMVVSIDFRAPVGGSGGVGGGGGAAGAGG